MRRLGLRQISRNFAVDDATADLTQILRNLYFGQVGVARHARSRLDAVRNDVGMHGKASGPQDGHAAARSKLLGQAGGGAAGAPRHDEAARQIVDWDSSGLRRSLGYIRIRPTALHEQRRRRITAPSRCASATARAFSAHALQLAWCILPKRARGPQYILPPSTKVPMRCSRPQVRGLGLLCGW